MDSLNRHEQLLRIFHLIDILFGARAPLSTAELKERLRARGVVEEMSDKNLRRDIEFLVRFGYAVKESKKRSSRGGSCLAWAIQAGRGAEELAGPPVTLSELLSLGVARDLLAPLAGTVYWRGVGQLFAKLERVATPALLTYVEEHREGLVVHPKPVGQKYRSRTLNAINRAIRRSLELEIRYTSLADTHPRRSVIRPEALVVYDGAIYIAGCRVPGPVRPRRRPGHAADDGALRFFKLDRLHDVHVTSRTFTRRAESIESLLADSMTLFRGATPPRAYRIRVDAARARWACEKPFHPRQRVLPLPDGAVILEIDRAWDDEMIPQVLGLGDQVEVLEPHDVRERIADMAGRIAARHAGTSGAPRAPRLRVGG
jgi:predicted DNA-binding transcriptional regulator YafY